MEVEKKKRKNYFLKIISNIFKGIKQHSLHSDIFYLLSNLLEIINYIIIIDIIGNYKREWINYHSYLYFLSPVFYYQYLLNVLGALYNTSAFPKEYYNTDQISLLIESSFKTSITYVNINDTLIISTFVIIILIILLISIQLIKYKSIIVTIGKYFSAFMLFFIFKTLQMTFILIFTHPLISQISHYAFPISYLFIFEVIFAFAFNTASVFFYNYFIYAYYTHIVSYFLYSNRYIIEYTLSLLSAIILSLRISRSYSFIFHLIWIINFIYYFYLMTYDFLMFINKTKTHRITFFIVVMTVAIFITRLITLLLISIADDIVVFQIFEIIIEVLSTIIIYRIVLSYETIVTLGKINEYLEKDDERFFFGLHQLFSPLQGFFRIKTKQNKMIEKHKEIFFSTFKKDIQEVFCVSQKDFDLLEASCGEKLSLALSNTKQSTITLQEKEQTNLLDLLVKLINYFNKKAKKKQNIFGRRARELLIYKKVLLFFIFDEKSYRAEFFIKKFIYSYYFNSLSDLAKAIFKALNYHFLSLEKKNEDNSLGYLIHFLSLNNEYLAIEKAFNIILKSFSNSQRDLMAIIDNQSSHIGRSFDKIIHYNEQSKDSMKIKEQPEKEKFKFIEELMFSTNIDKNFDYYDLTSLDTIVDKNNCFILLYEKSNFIIQKAPIVYTQLTGHKSSKMNKQILCTIFPFIMKKTQAKMIKKKLLSKRTNLIIESVIETNQHYLIGITLQFNMLPSINGKIYIIASLHCKSMIDDSNYIIMQHNGHCQEFGLFFNHYFGLDSSSKQINFLTLFCIENYDPSKTKKHTVTIKIEKLLQELKKLLMKDTTQRKDVNILLQKIKERLNKNTSTVLQLEVKNTYMMNNIEYYLIQFNFEDIKQTNLGNEDQMTNNQRETIDLGTRANNTISNTRSGSSVLSFKVLKETNWNITSKRNEKSSSNKNILDQISLYYNLILIAAAIGLSILIQIFSDLFYADFIQLTTIRQVNTEYYFGQLHLTNAIIIEGCRGMHNSLEEYHKQNIPEYTTELKDYYKKYFVGMSTGFFSVTNDLLKNLTNLSKRSVLYSYIHKNFSFIQNDGSFVNETYLTQFNVPKNYFYILSHIEDYYIEIPLIPYDDVKTTIKTLEDNQQYTLSLIYNSYIFLLTLKDIIYYSKKNFLNSLTTFKIFNLSCFIAFLLSNVFSLFLLYLSIRNSDNKILIIAEKLIAIEKKQREFLVKKLKVVKKLILNEMKPSIALKQMKDNYLSLHPIKVAEVSNNVSIEAFNVNDSSINNNAMNDNNNEKEDNGSLLLNNNKKQKKERIYFKVYISVIKVFAGLASIYIIFSIITIPTMINYLEQIDLKRLETDSVDDLQGLLLMYILDVRYSIFFNKPEKVHEIKLFTGFTEYIYHNYTLLNKNLFTSTSSDYIEYIQKINSHSDCSQILPQDDFFESMNAVCKAEPELQSTLEVMISNYINHIRQVYNIFVLSKRTEQDIKNAFHNEIFQRASLIESIYIILFLSDVKFKTLLPMLQGTIRELSIFLVVIFVMMVIAQIINYFMNTLVVMKKLSNSLENFIIIEKFFIMEKNAPVK